MHGAHQAAADRVPGDRERQKKLKGESKACDEVRVFWAGSYARVVWAAFRGHTRHRGTFETMSHLLNWGGVGALRCCLCVCAVLFVCARWVHVVSEKHGC